MKIKFIIISIICSLFFTSIIYNIDISERAIRYFLICTFYSLFYLYTNYYFKLKNDFRQILIIVSTPIFIDSTVFFTYPQMIPLRFPFSSLFPVLGCTLSFFLHDTFYFFLFKL